MTKSQEKQKMNNVHAWEKIAHCPVCGHTKCSNCITEYNEETYDPDDCLPQELRNKRIYCCACDESRELDHWVDNPYLEDYGGFDKRIAKRRSLSQAEFEREQIAKQRELEQEREKGRGKPGAYEEWLAGWTQNENGRWTNHDEKNSGGNQNA